MKVPGFSMLERVAWKHPQTSDNLNAACPIAIGPFWAVDAILLGVRDVGFSAWNFFAPFSFWFC